MRRQSPRWRRGDGARRLPRSDQHSRRPPQAGTPTIMNELPKRPKSHVIDSRAVALLQRTVADRGWIFRTLPADYGIDAEIEVVDVTDNVTGALIRAQIKGSSQDSKTIHLRASTARYLSLSLVPIVLIHVNTSTGAIRCRMLEGDELQPRSSAAGTVTISLRDACPIEDAWDLLEDLAVEHQGATLDLTNYTMYNPAAQLVRCVDLFLNFGGDAAAMVRWLRAKSPDQALVYNLGYAVYLKDELARDPSLLDKLRLWVLDISPDLEERIDENLRLFRSGRPVGRAAEVPLDE